MITPAVNKNIESGVTEPIIKTGSSSDVISFDDLESMEAAPKPSRKTEEKKGAQTKSSPETADKATKGKDKDKGEEVEEDTNPEKEDKNGKERKDNKDSKENSKTKGKEEINQQTKVIKAKSGDQEIDLLSNAQIEVTVDGKKESVTVEDLMKEYSGKTNWGKKYQELDTERKAFQNERQEIQSGIDKLLDLSKEDPQSAVEYLYSTLGENAKEHIDKLKAQILGQFDEWSKLTPEQRREREIQDEADHHKKRADRLEADRTNRERSTALDTRVKAIQEKYNLDQASFVARYDELKQLKASGKFDGEITPELVGDYHQEIQKHEQVESILNEVNPDLEGKEGAFKELKDLWDKDPSLTVEQLKKIAADVYGSEAARKLAKKIQRSSGGVKQLTSPPVKAKKDEPLFFEDIE